MADGEGRPDLGRAWDIGVWVWRFVGAIALAYSFIAVLMVASVQTTAAARLAALARPADYSSANLARREIAAISADLKTLREGLVTISRARDGAEQATYPLANRLNALRTTVEKYPACAATPAAAPAAPGTPAATPADGPVSFDRPSLAEIVGLLRACSDNPGVPAATRQAVLAFIGASPDAASPASKLDALENDWASLERQVVQRMGEIRDKRAEYDEAVAYPAGTKEARASFAEIDEIRDGALPVARLLIRFPPPLIRIILAFTSGLFGGLLITLVLVVYPNNSLHLTSAAGAYEARILLGGLISICVFVLLGGGTAVLGTASALGDANSNYLAFCAIGILAGMFSDRAAAWLSDRADILLSRRKPAAGAADEEARAAAEPAEEQAPAAQAAAARNAAVRDAAAREAAARGAGGEAADPDPATGGAVVTPQGAT